MTSHEFIEDGIRYIPSRIAAKSTDLTPDYISRMCREGRVLATWHRGAWYVNETSLATVLAERRRKQEQLARAQSDEFKRVLGPANAAETSVVTRDTAAHVRRSRAPFVALTITLLIATSVFAPPQTVRENLAAQLPFRIPSALTELPQLPTNTGSQLAAAATSFPNFIKEKIQSVFCWWLECKTTTVEIAQQRPRPSTSTNIVPPITAATSTRVVSNTPTQISVTPQPPQTVNQPIIERVRETVRTIVSGGIDAAFVDARLAALDRDLSSRMNFLSSANSSQTTNVYNTVSAALRIENLDDVNITGSRWTGGSITGATITGGLVAATTFSGVLDISTGGTGTSSAPTYGRVLLGNASGSYDLVATSSLGIVGTGSSGADFGKTFELGSGALSPTTTVGLIIAASSTFNGGLSIDRSTTTSATSTNLFATLGRFTSGIIDALTATAATITNLTANTLVATNATSTRIDALDYVAVGRTATTTIRGDGVASTIPYASSTAITVSGTASTSNLVASNSFTLANLSGILKATAGAVASAFVDLASDVIGILPVTNGGTGWASLASAAIPYGNGAGALATTTVGTPGQILALLNGVPTWTASSTLSTITGTLGVSQGGTGLTATPTFGQILRGTGSGFALVATSTLGVDLGDTTGTLAASRGGTGITSPSAAGILLGSYAGGSWQQLATSSLGLLTTNVAEGSNLFYTDARVQSFIHSSTTIPKTYTTNVFTGGNLFLASTTIGAGTQTTGLTISGGATTTGNAYFAGNVGVGTPSPTQPLTVIGTTTLGSFGAGNDQARGLNVTSGNITFAAPLSSGSYDPSILTRFVYGSVAQDYGVMPNGTTWVQNRSLSDFATNFGYLINPNGGNVGIGTTSPTQILSLRAAGGAKLYLEDANNAVNWTLGQTNTAPFSISQNGNTWLTIAHNTGNVGIGTTSPNALLTLSSATTPTLRISHTGASGDAKISLTDAGGDEYTIQRDITTGFLFTSGTQTTFSGYRWRVNGTTDVLTINNSGNVGIGTTTPASLNGFSQVLSLGGIAPAITLRSTNSGGTVWEIGNDTSGNFRLIRDAAVSAVTVNTSGNLGLASTSPWRTLSVTGTAGFSSSLSAESGSDEVLCIDPATFEMTRGGASCAASSLRYKENIQDLTYGLDDVLSMRPVSFQWTLAERPNDRSLQVGFIAEEMVGVVPEVVEMNASGTPEGIDYDKLTSVLARAIQQIAAITGTFKQNLIAWLASATNGIGDFFAEHIIGKKVTTDELCVGTMCVTEDQFKAVFSPAAPASPPTSVTSPPSEIRDPGPSISVTSPSETRDVPDPQDPPLSNSTTAANDPGAQQAGNGAGNPSPSATLSPQTNTLLIEEPATSPESDAAPPEPANDPEAQQAGNGAGNPAPPSAEAI